MDILQYISGILFGWSLFGLSKHGDFILEKKCRRNSYIYLIISMLLLIYTIKF
jgi:hypothetical protein